MLVVFSRDGAFGKGSLLKTRWVCTLYYYISCFVNYECILYISLNMCV